MHIVYESVPMPFTKISPCLFKLHLTKLYAFLDTVQLCAKFELPTSIQFTSELAGGFKSGAQVPD